MNKTYLIEVNYTDGKSETIQITTDRLNWSMEQYQRNREPLTWKILE